MKHVSGKLCGVAAVVALTVGCGWADEESNLAACEANAAQPERARPAAAVQTMPTTARVGWREDTPVPTQGLAGRRIATEASHGRIWYNSVWKWQREDWFPGQHVYSSQEDYNSARMMNRWLLPYFENAGAVVYNDRCRDEQTAEILADLAGTGAPHEVTGTWQVVSSSASRGGQYLTASTVASSVPTATFRIRTNIAQSGFYGVTVWFPAVAGASQNAQYVVIDGAGNRHAFRVNQSADTARWVWLDRFYFEAGTSVPVLEVTNASATAGQTVVLDTVRLGGGMGSEDFGGGVSGVARWQECAVNWTKYLGAPSSVWGAPHAGEDYGTRFQYAGWQSAELFVRLHTNGSTGHTGYGTEVYQYWRNTEEQSRLNLIYPKLIQSIRSWYNPGWRDRGVKANSQTTWSFPYLMVELAFHDYLTDTQALMDAKFRRAAMRGYYEGVVDFFTNGTGVYSPEPPESISVRNMTGGQVHVAWQPSAMGGAPTGYRVYYSTHPYCWKDYVAVSAPATSADIGSLTPGQITYIQLRALNDGGISFPSETLVAMVPSAVGSRRILVVNGFDRFDWDVDETDNRRNFSIHHARAIADAATSLAITVVIDSCANEAVAQGSISLPGYQMVDWMLGEESTADDSFNATEQSAVAAYRQVGGTLLVSGSDFAFDLANSSLQTEHDYLDQVLQTGFTSDNAAAYAVTGVAAGVFDGVTLDLDSGLGDAYRVLAPDVIAARNGSSVCMNYGTTSSPAGISNIQAGSSLFCFAFPFEAIQGAAQRQAVMTRILDHVAAPSTSARAGWELLE
jgi:hypothetical protein